MDREVFLMLQVGEGEGEVYGVLKRGGVSRRGWTGGSDCDCLNTGPG